MKTTGLMIAFVLWVFSMQAQQARTNTITVSLEQEEAENVLTWTTTREVNTSHFLVERTTDGLHYEMIATLKAAGSTVATRAYTFTDSEMPAENASYRVTLVNMEGLAIATKAVNPAAPIKDHVAVHVPGK